MNKKGKTFFEAALPPVLVITLVLFVAQSAGIVDLRTMFAGITGVELPDDDVLEFCGIEDITMKISDYKKDAMGTDPSKSSAVFIDLNGDGVRDALEDIGDVADDGSTTVGVNVDYWVYGGWNAGSGGSYYVQKLSGNTNCRDPLQLNVELAAQDASVSHVVTNDDGTLNSGAALSLDDEEQTTIDVKVWTTAKEYYGNPELGSCNIAVIEYNSTGYDEITLSGAPIGGIAPTPGSHSLVSVANTTKSYYFAPLDMNKQEFRVHIDVGTVSPDALGGFGISIYDCDIDLDADTNEEIIGVEDEDNNELGSTTEPFIIVDVS